MKKTTALIVLLLITVCMTVMGCAQKTAISGTTAPDIMVQEPTAPPTEPPTEPIPMNTESMDFLKLLYKEDDWYTPVDYYLVDLFPVGDVTYKVVWTTDAPEDVAKIISNEDGTVFVDINEQCKEETTYTLTASIATAEGYRLTHSWKKIIPAGRDMVSIVEEAYTLKKGERMDHQVTLTGEIISVDKEWSEDYQHITVTIVVEGCEGKPIRCYSLTGEGVEELQRGDMITVTGILQNYSSRVEFDIGCTFVKGTEDPGKDEEYEELEQ